jgi:predicted nuclease of predicted toxin-antitoxin system
VKLLLDEIISAVVAERLRGRGRDVEAVTERRELRGLTDRDLFEYAQGAERSVVTYNRDDFLELDRLYRAGNRPHCGVVILNPRRFPQGPASIGPLVTSLDRLIAAGPLYESFIHWLQCRPDGIGRESISLPNLQESTAISEVLREGEPTPKSTDLQVLLTPTADFRPYFGSVRSPVQIRAPRLTETSSFAGI